MDAKKLSVGALVMALVALALGTTSLVSGGGGSRDSMEGIGKAEGELTRLSNDVTEIEQGLARIKSAHGDSLAGMQELGAKVNRLSGQTARLDRAVAEAAEKRSAAPGGQAEIDPAKLRELVNAEIQAAFQRMRAGRGQPRDQQAGQQRGAPARVDLAQVPETAKAAAVKAVEGFKVDHVHPGGKTEDGKDIFDIDGAAGGRSYRVRVTAEGTVIESAARGGRGGRPRGNRGGNQPPAAPAEGGGDNF